MTAHEPPRRWRRVALGAVTAVARRELRRRWQAIVALGVAAGLVGGLALGVLAVARRTATAYDRLVAATALDDARVYVFSDDPQLTERVATLPEVEQAWVGSMVVAQLQGPDVEYASILSGPRRSPDLFAPLVVAGRLADPTQPAEVVAAEGWARPRGVLPGTSLRLKFLTAAEFRDFDVGFGEPDGPSLEVRVVGVVRIAAPDKAPLYAGPAFAAGPAAATELRAASVVRVRLRQGRTGIAEFRRRISALSGASGAAASVEEFLPVEIDAPEAVGATVRATTRVLVGGLAVLAVVALLAGGLALAQAFARHHATTAAEQRIEAALGLTRGERAGARTMASGIGGGLAAMVATAAVVVAGFADPPGSVRASEPHPGFAPNVAMAAAAGVGVGIAFAGLAFLAAWRAGRTGARSSARVGTGSAAISGRAVPGSPTLPAALALTVPLSGAGGPTVPVRTTLAGAVVGAAGLVAATTFAVSLQRLVTTPARWGWQADASIYNATGELVARLLSDHRLGGVTLLDRATVRVGGVAYEGHAITALRGSAGWTLISGRPPRQPDEVVVGTRVRRQVDVDVGDTLKAEKGELRVVGVGVGPALPQEPLGRSVLLTPEGLAGAAQTGALREALIQVAPRADGDAVFEDLAAQYEVAPRAPPGEVANLDELGPLPFLLGAFLAAVGVAALAHALVATVRYRRPELAVLRVLGFTPAQAGGTVAVLALMAATAGVVVGVLLGFGAGRLVWWAVAYAANVATGPAVPWSTIAAVAVGAPVVSLVAALVPVRVAARLRPGAALRRE